MASSKTLSMQYNLSKEKINPVYVVAGERPLTAPVVADLLDKLLSEDERECNLDIIPGENFREDILLEKLNTRPFFPGRKVVLLKDPPFARGMEDRARSWKRVIKAIKEDDLEEAKRIASILFSALEIGVSDLKSLKEPDQKRLLNWPKDESLNVLKEFLNNHELTPAPERKRDNGFKNVLNWISRTDPQKTVLIIETDFYDAGSSFYKKVKEFGPILEMGGDVRDKRKEGERAIQYVRTYLKKEKKEIEQEAVSLLLEQTGKGSLVPLKTELEKLVQRAGERILITKEDVQELTTRHREEEIFKITDAICEKNISKALNSLHLLILQGIHPIAIFQTIVTFLRRMLTLKAICETEGISPGDYHISYQVFQRDFFPKIKIDSMHPYPLYKMFLQSEKFDQEKLMDTFLMLPWIDLELKGGEASARVLLENLIFQIIIKETSEKRTVRL